MTARQSSPSDAPSDSNVRKRVCKACDRCRLKKSKCDGANPCGRCRADNAICVFGERKKAHDKVYPKGYVEMLEQQQAWLVHALQELYRRSRDGHGWPGEPLKCESNGHPLTHDLLSRLGALDQSRGDCFEENPDAMQQRLWSQHSGQMQRQDSSDAMQQRLWSQHSGQMQRQDSSDASSDGGAQSPLVTSFAQQLPPTPPSSFSPARAVQSQPQSQPQPQPQPQPPPVKSEQLENPAYAPQMPMQGVVNPIALQGGPQWPSGFGSPFDGVDYDYPGLSFDEQYRPVPLNCIPSASLMDTKSDYEDFNQFLSNSTEIPSI